MTGSESLHGLNSWMGALPGLNRDRELLLDAGQGLEPALDSGQGLELILERTPGLEPIVSSSAISSFGVRRGRWPSGMTLERPVGLQYSCRIPPQTPQVGDLGKLGRRNKWQSPLLRRGTNGEKTTRGKHRAYKHMERNQGELKQVRSN